MSSDNQRLKFEVGEKRMIAVKKMGRQLDNKLNQAFVREKNMV